MQTSICPPKGLFEQTVRYEIPPFQRSYVWEQEAQWEPLWQDVERLAQSIVDGGDAGVHFMGAIVLQQIPVRTGQIERRKVVDGQQRLTTLQLLIDSVRAVLDEQGYSHPAERLRDLVANRKAHRADDEDYAFKVWPTVADRAAFKYAISGKQSTETDSTSPIVKAHEYFRCQAEQWLRQFKDKTEDKRHDAADSLDAAVRDRLQLVIIDLGNADNPHVIFETLNARGTPLRQSDMIKNMVLHKAIRRDSGNEATEEASRLWPFDRDRWWRKAVGRGLQRRPRIDVFLNHWLTLRRGAETKPYAEFDEFRRYASGKGIRKVAKDLRKTGRTYHQVEDFERLDIKRFVQRRDVMGVGVVTPLLLWLLDAGLSAEKLADSLRAIESFLVRRVVCRKHARSYGGLFVELIARLRKAPPDHGPTVITSFLAEQTTESSIWPSDDDLLGSFLTEPLYDNITLGRLRMVLEGTEEGLLSRSKSESDEVPSKLHVEHIMPQAWRRKWPPPNDPDYNGEDDRDRLIHTIGNLTLVTGPLNSSLSDVPWSRKREALQEHSVLHLNKWLVNNGPDEWDEAAIKKRAVWLHEQAVKVWPRPTTNVS